MLNFAWLQMVIRTWISAQWLANYNTLLRSSNMLLKKDVFSWTQNATIMFVLHTDKDKNGKRKWINSTKIKLMLSKRSKHLLKPLFFYTLSWEESNQVAAMANNLQQMSTNIENTFVNSAAGFGQWLSSQGLTNIYQNVIAKKFWQFVNKLYLSVLYNNYE